MSPNLSMLNFLKIGSVLVPMLDFKFQEVLARRQIQIQIQILYSWQIHKTWVFIVTRHIGKHEKGSSAAPSH